MDMLLAVNSQLGTYTDRGACNAFRESQEKMICGNIKKDHDTCKHNIRRENLRTNQLDCIYFELNQFHRKSSTRLIGNQIVSNHLVPVAFRFKHIKA